MAVNPYESPLKWAAPAVARPSTYGQRSIMSEVALPLCFVATRCTAINPFNNRAFGTVPTLVQQVPYDVLSICLVIYWRIVCLDSFDGPETAALRATILPVNIVTENAHHYENEQAASPYSMTCLPMGFY